MKNEEEEEIRRINRLGGVAVLVVGAVIALILLMNQTETTQVVRTSTGEWVRVMEAKEEFLAPRVTAQGTVVPARKVTLQPQVSGRVAARHSGLVSGGVVQAGETLLQIETRDYEIAVEEARTGVELARAELSMEEGRQVVAKEEWERFGTPGEEPPPLALREPQLRQAELAISQAEQRLQRARLNLERTRLRAPFAALVTDSSIEIGELVTPSQAAATLVALDEFWVQVSVPLDAMGLIALPGRDGELGSRAFVRHQYGERVAEYEGQVIRLLGDLDPAGRMARILVRVEDPFSLSGVEREEARPDRPALQQQPLMLGSYVSVELEGALQRDVIELPRLAIHEGKYVYIADEEDRLRKREVSFAWRGRETVAVDGGLQEGERVIISGMPAPVEGMPLRVEVVETPEPAEDLLEDEEEVRAADREGLESEPLETLEALEEREVLDEKEELLSEEAAAPEPERVAEEGSEEGEELKELEEAEGGDEVEEGQEDREESEEEGEE